jgi:hypothetical protein
VGANTRSVQPLTARVNVTQTIRWAIRKIAASHPELGAHLGERIKTGYRCAYRLDPSDEWRV